MSHNAFFNQTLPKEIWIEIAKYLGANDLEKFRYLCKALKVNIHKLDVLWQPFLNRLHAMDKSISLIPKNGQTIREAFIEGFNKIKIRLKKELDYITRQGYEYKESATLDLLEKINKDLDNRNCKIIASYLVYHPSTFISVLEPISRVPAQLFKDPKYTQTWKEATTLDLSGNLLESLPEEMEICQNLTALDCKSNKFMHLPSVINKLPKLTIVNFSDNQLTEIPEIFEKLFTSLIVFNFRHNPLELGTIPKSYRDKIVECYGNRADVVFKSYLTNQVAEPSLFNQEIPPLDAPTNPVNVLNPDPYVDNLNYDSTEFDTNSDLSGDDDELKWRFKN
jgi:hypothetical protein